MTAINTQATPAPAPAAIPKCGGCGKPVDVVTAVKRPIYSTSSGGRYGRYAKALTKPVTLHYCDIACRQRADNDYRR